MSNKRKTRQYTYMKVEVDGSDVLKKNLPALTKSIYLFIMPPKTICLSRPPTNI